jgi:hypothetical protein
LSNKKRRLHTSYQERRDRRSRGRQLLARVHTVVDASPDAPIFAATLDQERAERAGAELWQRWREVIEPPRPRLGLDPGNERGGLSTRHRGWWRHLHGTGTILFGTDGRFHRIPPGDPAERRADTLIDEVQELSRGVSGDR